MTGAAAAAAGDVADLLFDRMIQPTAVGPAGYDAAAPAPLVGRAGDLERLGSALTAPDAGVVMVTGPAGVGKSRLVTEFFRRHRTDGTVEVFDFGQVADVPAFRRTLRRLRERRHESPDGLEHLGEDGHTVVFDHVEDVAGDLAPLLTTIRRCCPRLRMVVVGTTRIGLYGERVVRLRPLPTKGTAGATSPAVELFVHCARAVRPDFALTMENEDSVGTLCHLAGGLPFTIELAASQVALAEPDLILERFGHGSGDLRRIGRHPYSRHSSVGDLTSWVLARLHADEWALLTSLAIFEGPFTTRAAAEVVGGFDAATYRTMERLLDKSVLVPGERRHGEVILSVPNNVRLAAAGSLARLPVHPVLRRAHAEYFRTVTGTGGLDLRADLLAAYGYWREAGAGEAMASIANALLGQSTGEAHDRRCLELVEEALRAGVDDPRLRARTLETAGETAMRLDVSKARGYLAQARDAYREADDEDGTVRCLILLADDAYATGDLDRARDHYEQALATDTEPPHPNERTSLMRRLAVVLRDAGSLGRAEEVARATLAAELGREDFGAAVLTRYVLASIRWLGQDSAETRALFADAAAQLGRLPETAEQPECLEMLAIILGRWGRITDWRPLTAVLGTADRLRQRSGAARPEPLSEKIMPILAAAGEALTSDEYVRAWQAGAEPSWAEALRLVPDDEPAADTAPDVADILTKRELEVALLVAEGLTNRVIARRLGIAEWTVVNHLRKVMRKLGCQSRVQVARRLSIR
ncbi:tetratricopeptide repeat protein [Actinomadura pelletieri DSM 43383]|uniref:Tetratricopeptide repeat protein n=1 Tax=Actinomadura pelletieri DSM 43383 TaxID=1120940 RepID=A0A495QT02_9ACTN|nr:LuxR C-terminal-related transcriptional regulator [Actinomadura pelletieri]RKS76646.1 tetratricopeptide repeat protein [Actinomadura pelletieri DSM 43383]